MPRLSPARSCNPRSLRPHLPRSRPRRRRTLPKGVYAVWAALAIAALNATVVSGQELQSEVAPPPFTPFEAAPPAYTPFGSVRRLGGACHRGPECHGCLRPGAAIRGRSAPIYPVRGRAAGVHSLRECTPFGRRLPSRP